MSELDASSTHVRVTSQGDEALVEIVRKSPNMEYISLGENELVTNEGLTSLVELKHLNSLLLDGANVGDAGMRSISRISSLVSLNVSNSLVRDQGLTHISQLPNLQQLHLRRCNVSDEGIFELLEIPNLRILNISDCVRLTDIALGHLAELETLERVFIHGCDKMPEEAISELQRKLPRCEVTR